MPPNSNLPLLACLLALALAAPPAAAGPAAERARIQAERDRLSADYAAQEAACATRFEVTACAREVRLRRREALGVLRTQTLALDDAERRERAAARIQAVDTKRRQAAQRQASAPPEPRTPVPHPPAPAARLLVDTTQREAASQARGQASKDAAAQRAVIGAQRQQDALAAAARIEARQAERARKGKTAAPLAPPPAAAASR